MWVRDGSLVNNGDPEKQREIQSMKNAGRVYVVNSNQQEMREGNPRNINNLMCVIRELTSNLNAYNPNINSSKG